MPRVRINPFLPVLLCLMYRLDPVGCFWPFLVAAAVHELSHGLAVTLQGGVIHQVHLGLNGATLETCGLSYRAEAISALAGPVSGFLLAIFSPVNPWLGFWGIILGLYNLLPVYPMDGGRALRCALLMRCSYTRALSISRWVTAATGTAVACLGICASFVWNWGLWPCLLSGLFLYRVLTAIGTDA